MGLTDVATSSSLLKTMKRAIRPERKFGCATSPTTVREIRRPRIPVDAHAVAKTVVIGHATEMGLQDSQNTGRTARSRTSGAYRCLVRVTPVFQHRSLWETRRGSSRGKPRILRAISRARTNHRLRAVFAGVAYLALPTRHPLQFMNI